MKRTTPARSVPHDQKVIERLRNDPRLASQYLKAAMEDEDEPQVLLMALRRIAQARGGIAAVARKAGVKRESLHRALAEDGNPRLSTLYAVAKAIGMRLTVDSV